MDKIQFTNQLLQERRSVYPASYIDKKIDKEIIQQILENANRAPTHRFTEPWRFKVIQGEKRQELGDFLAKKYVKFTPEESFNPLKLKKISEKCLQADTIILICMQRDAAERVPEWEEIAATSMAVQNMYLTCSAYEIGCYWSSPKSIQFMNEFCALSDGEVCLGILYLGYYKRLPPLSTRTSIANKVEWLL